MEKTELENLLDFREHCRQKGQTLSKPKSDRLIELLKQELDARKNLDGYERDTK